MDKQALDTLIDKSILGTLTSYEESKLEAYIMEQPATKLEITMRTDILKGFEYNADQELKDVLNKIHNEEILNASPNKLLKRIGVILISLAVMCGSYSLYKMINNSANSSTTDGPVLYASYFQPYTPSLETRSNEKILDDAYQIFIDAYRAQNYLKSLETITPLIESADNNTLLMAGISAMETGKTQESLEYLNKIIDSNDFYFIDHAKWYKSLVLIKENKIQEANLLLNELANSPKADHHDESVSLLREI
jgi:tetratricopeptide (TPR) repeat protein